MMTSTPPTLEELFLAATPATGPTARGRDGAEKSDDVSRASAG